MDQSEEVDLEHLIVDVSQEQRLGSVLSLCQGVMPVLSLGKVNNGCLCKYEDYNESANLYEQPLDPGGVCPVVEEPPGVVTQRVVLPQALRQPVHPLHSGIG